MNRTVAGTMMAVFAAVGLVAAQAASQADSPSRSQARPETPSASSSQSKNQTITYTGCLEAGATSGSYVLSNVTDDSAKAGAASSLEGQRFALSSPPSSFNMASNLNHKVQITGTVAPSSASATTPPAAVPPEPNAGKAGGNMGDAGGARTQTPAAMADANLSTITMKSAKSVGDRCGL